MTTPDLKAKIAAAVQDFDTRSRLFASADIQFVDKMRAERDISKAALLALVAELPAGPDWQPISTAPKDGHALDLWVVPSKTIVLRASFRVPNAYWLVDEGGEGFWVDRFGNAVDWNEPGKQRATHWLRITAPTPETTHD